MAEGKICAADGCANNAAASGSYCSKKHYYLLKREREGKPARTARGNRADAAEPDVAEVNSAGGKLVSLTLHLSDARCNAIFSGLSLERKAAALSTAFSE